MKKLYTLLTFISAVAFANAQTVIYDNGPLVNSPGAGTGGADVSNTHDGLINYGFNQNYAAGFFVADDFTVPAGETWNIDSIVIYAYQTNSGNTSSITEMYAYIVDKSPDDPSAAVVAGDSVSNIISDSQWSGIYRTGETTLSSTARPIMRTSGSVSATLSSGDYWLVWAVSGSASFSGPWNPPITQAGITITGNAKQWYATNAAWADIVDTAQAGAQDDATQGFPFLFVGNVVTGISNNSPNVSVNFFPNPVETTSEVYIYSPELNLKQTPATFIVSDLTGREVKRINQITDSHFTFNRGSMSQGVYLYKILQGDKNLKTGKFNIN